jgi:hypothetical protein
MYTLVQQGVANILVIGPQELRAYHSEANYRVDDSNHSYYTEHYQDSCVGT